VYLCKDLHTEGKLRAVKVVRRVDRYSEAARIEARLLREVNDADPRQRSLSVRFYESFTHRGHVCLVFDALGPSLYHYLKKNQYSPLPLYCV